MTPNFLIPVLASLIPLIVGAIWYHPKIMGNAWMKAADMTEEKIKGANMAIIFGLTLVFSLLLSFSIYFMVVHQAHIYSVLADDPGMKDESSSIFLWVQDFMSKYGNNFRTFKHGALHGFIGGFTVATPVLVINALFERKGAKYIAINAAYWSISMMLMGGVICAYA